jgi:hypothetical protein
VTAGHEIIWLMGLIIENCHWENFAKSINF